MTVLVSMPVLHCTHCTEDRPHQVVNVFVYTCAVCGTRRGR